MEPLNDEELKQIEDYAASIDIFFSTASEKAEKSLIVFIYFKAF